MNMFNVLDGLIKGSVQFLLDLLYSLGTLIVHPLTGATRLYRDDQDRSKVQISSLTFLVLVLLIGGMIDAAYVRSDNSPDSTLGEITGMLTTGAQPRGFGPILAGVVISVILIALMLRGLAGVAGLDGRRCQRFVAVMEYELGLFLLLIAFLTLLEMSPLGTSMDLLAFLYLILPIAIVSLGAQFWISLLRTPRLHRLRRRLPRLRRRWTRRHYGGAAPGRGGSLSALFLCSLLVLIVLPIAAMPPMLLGWAGKQGGWEVSSWMIELDRSREAAKAREAAKG